MREKDVRGEASVPPALLRSGPRHVRLTAAGKTVVVAAGLTFVILSWVATIIYARGREAERRVELFKTASAEAMARVVDIRRQGDNNARIYYVYRVGDATYRSSGIVRRRERERYRLGTGVAVRYLLPEPTSSWLPGQAPRRNGTAWALALPAGAALGMAVIVWVIRRQRMLLEYGRPALATVTGTEKRRSDKGTYWRVQYEWRLLTGATRGGRFSTATKTPPEVGSRFVLVYDRDRPERHRQYPLPFVTTA